MNAEIKPSNLSGIIKAPASKSSMQRAMAAALLANGESVIHNAGESNDDRAAIEIIKTLGASVTSYNGSLRIQPPASPNNDPGDNRSPLTLNCGESGLAIRMFTPIAALRSDEVIITGEGSLATRPMEFFDEVLPLLNVKLQSNQGRLPIKIKGPLQPRNIEVDGSLSSQFLTGLLMAYSAAGARDVSIKVRNLKSKPYIDLTLDVMQRFGLKTPENRDYNEFYFFGSNDQVGENVPAEREYSVESDWSGGAFLLVAGALAGAITVKGLDLDSAQADKKIMDALYQANASVAIEAKGIRVRPSKMTSFVFDATDCPDLFPPLVALASFCEGVSSIKGVERLAHKESNRAVSLQQEFEKMGVRIDINNNEMLIHGTMPNGGSVHSHHDHRIAMSCAIAALNSRDKTIIHDAEAVNKSYPHFFEDLKKLGADVSLSNKLKYT